jgi:peptide-methionine (S)-S-oxide reductase
MDALFSEAVSAIDAGDVKALKKILADHPELLQHRLETPAKGYFQRPYLLWFVAENPLRNETLPANIAEITRTIIEAAKREGAVSLQEQLDYTLALVVTGRVPRECRVQRALIDVLIDAGATPGDGNGALGARNLEGVEQLIDRGAPLTLATALCLGRFDDAATLANQANDEDRQPAMVAAAFNGNADAIRILIDLGVDVNARSSVIHPHATPLHHAVDSGSLDAVMALVDAGARLDTRDRIYDGTPLDWAEHLGRTEVAAYLRQLRT